MSGAHYAYSRLKNLENRLNSNYQHFVNMYMNTSARYTVSHANRDELARLKRNFNAAVSANIAQGKKTQFTNLKKSEQNHANLNKKIKEEKKNFNKTHKGHYGAGTYFGYKNYNSYVSGERKKREMNAKHAKILNHSTKLVQGLRKLVNKHNPKVTAALSTIRKKLFSPGAPFNRLLHDPNKGMRTATMLNTRGSVSYKRHFDKIRNLEREIRYMKARK
jgi:hypothetical protein